MKYETTNTLRILDFDIENRPLSYWYDGNPTAEVTAIAWSWLELDVVNVRLLSTDQGSMGRMLADFREAYDAADIVTGHYICRHDLPILNAAMVENGLGPLPSILASDTKTDLCRWGGLPQTQLHLADLMGLEAEKYNMTQTRWRDANRLTPSGLAETQKRVVDDVRQHKLLRARLIEEGLLGTPRRWHP